jgi:hypothetical protein
MSRFPALSVAARMDKKIQPEFSMAQVRSRALVPAAFACKHGGEISQRSSVGQGTATVVARSKTLARNTEEPRMLDEFDDDFDVEDLRHSAIAHRAVESPVRSRVARLVSRLYGAASAPLRTRMLACLVRPLGSLGLVAVASGAFARFLHRGSEPGAGIPIDDLGRYSNDQIFELARFVEQVSPDAIQQVAGLLADNPVGVSALGAAAAMLLVRAVRSPGPKSSGLHTAKPQYQKGVHRLLAPPED